MFNRVIGANCCCFGVFRRCSSFWNSLLRICVERHHLPVSVDTALCAVPVRWFNRFKVLIVLNWFNPV